MNREQIPFLLRLFDDPSPQVREKVRSRLLDFGTSLPPEVERLGFPVSPELRLFLLGLRGADENQSFSRAWQRLLEEYVLNEEITLNERDSEFLEAALELFARWQSGYFQPENAMHGSGESILQVALDALAERFRREKYPVSAAGLCDFLFSKHALGLRGASRETYYEPQNSNLVWVLQNRRGLPISLTCLLMMMGKRVGVRVEGCNYPGHFLARVEENGKYSYYDCFDGGRRLGAVQLQAMKHTAPRAFREATPSIVIIARVLSNLVVAYENTGALDKAHFLLEMLAELEHAAHPRS